MPSAQAFNCSGGINGHTDLSLGDNAGASAVTYPPGYPASRQMKETSFLPQALDYLPALPLPGLNVFQPPTDKAHATSTNTPYNNHTKFTQTQQQTTSSTQVA